MGKIEEQITDQTVSVIVPVYNVEKYLEQCIESIIQQTYRSLEIIIVNDGSTDGSSEIARRYVGQDDRIILLEKKNGGLSDARNYGLDRAAGDYVMFIDSDDFIEADMVEYLLKAIQKEDADIAVCGYRMVDDEGGKLPDREVFPKEKTVCSRDYWKVYHEEAYIYGVVAWNKLYHKTVFDRIRFPVGKIHEDEFILHKLLHNADRIVCCPEKKYDYRQRKGSIMNVGRKGRDQDFFSADALQAFLIRLKYFMKRGMFTEASYTFALAVRQVVSGYEERGSLTQQDKKRLIHYQTELKNLGRECLTKKIPMSFRVKIISILIDRRCFKFLRKLKHYRDYLKPGRESASSDT